MMVKAMQTLQLVFDDLISKIRSSRCDHTRMVLMDAAQQIAYGMKDRDDSFDLARALDRMHYEPPRLVWSSSRLVTVSA